MVTDQPRDPVILDREELEFWVNGTQKALHGGSPFSGIAFGRDPDSGDLDELIPYRSGARHGLCRRWDPSGMLVSEACFCRNLPHGPQREWTATGEIELEAYWACGVAIRRRRWSPAGALIEDFELPADDPEIARIERLQAEFILVDLELERFTLVERSFGWTPATAHATNIQALTARFDSHLRSGVVIERDPDTGEIIEMSGYERGSRHGPHRVWSSSGLVESEHYYAMGWRHGPWREWDEDGDLRVDAYYDSGALVCRREWDEFLDLIVDERASPEPKLSEHQRRHRRGPVVDIDRHRHILVSRPPGWGLARPKSPLSIRRVNDSQGASPLWIYVITGETFEVRRDVDSVASFAWDRRYASTRATEAGSLGFGWRHGYEVQLILAADRASFIDWDGEVVEFRDFDRVVNRWEAYQWLPDSWAVGVYSLSNPAPNRYVVWAPKRGLLVFEVVESVAGLRLVAFQPAGTRSTIEFGYRGPLVADCEVKLDGDVQERYRFDYEPTQPGPTNDRLVAIVEISPDHAERPCVGFRYSKQGDLVGVTDATDAEWSYAYDPAHRLTWRCDPRGQAHVYTYDEEGRCVRVGGLDGLFAARLEYSPDRRSTHFIYSDGATWEYHYDSRGLLLRKIAPYESLRSLEYGLDDNGDERLMSVINRGARFDYHYDEHGCTTCRIDHFGYRHPPDSSTERFWRFKPTTALSHRYGSSRPVAYGVPGQLPLAVRESLPKAALELADQLFRSVPPATELEDREQDPGNQYDRLGRVLRSTGDAGTTGYSYDPCGNLIERIRPDGRVDRWSYDKAGNEVEHVDPLGRVTRQAWSIRDDVTVRIDPVGNATYWLYALNDRVEAIWNGGRLRDFYVYENDEYCEKRDDSGALIFRNVAFSSTGLVTLRELASGGIHRFDYAPSGRIREASTAEHEVRIETDDQGRQLLDLRDGLGIERRREPSRVLTTVLERFELAVEGAPPEVLRGPSGACTMFERDVGVLIRRCSNGTTEYQRYDTDGRLLAQLVCAGEAKAHDHGRSGCPAWGARYSYSRTGELLAVHDSTRKTTQYRYDAADRLVAIQIDDEPERRYVYDDADNFRETPELGRVEVARVNQIVATGSERFHHDRRFRVSQREGPAGVTGYAYDSFDMLERVTRRDRSGQVLPEWTAGYDAVGRRLWKQDGERRHEFYWDQDRIAAEIDPAGRVRIYHYAYEGASVPLGFTDYASRDSKSDEGLVYQVFSDPTGLPLHIEDPSGAWVWTAGRLDPWGLVEIEPGATIEYNLRRGGHYYDAELGLVYNRYRYYDPGLGRYLTRNPTGFQNGGINYFVPPGNPLRNFSVLGI